MSERAAVFARAIENRDADRTRNVLHVYTDGLIAVLGGDEGRLTTVSDLIRQEFPSVEEARVEGVGVFIVLADLLQADLEDLPPRIVLLTTEYHDHREHDDDTIDLGVARVSGANRRS